MKTTALTTLAVLLLASTASAEEGKWMIRARALGVIPDESSTISAVGGKAEIDNSIVPEVDVSYFFSPNVALELIAAVTPHDITAHGTGLGNVDVGNVWLLPPTLTLQYHFTQFDSVKPYVGAGLNYTHFYNADAGSLNTVEYKDSFGAALQAGVDIPVQENWYLNFDIKKVLINTTAKFNGGAVRADVDIDPWIVGAGIGYRF